MTKQLSATPTLSAQEPLLTGEELFNMGDVGRAELVRGELIQFMPTGHPHGCVESNLAMLLGAFVKTHNLGRVLTGETGLYTQRDPDTVRGMDVAYISHERLAQVKSTSFLDVAPELVIEIMSPSDSWTEINDKIEEYFEVGVKLIWIVNPKRKRVHAYHSFTELDLFNTEDMLTGGVVLPDLEIRVADIFE